MELIALPTPLIRAGDDVAALLNKTGVLQDGDILVISSKVLATAEGAAVCFADLHISNEAYTWSEKTKRDVGFMQAVMNETTRLNGTIIGHCPGALLTELRPTGLDVGTIVAPNAGMDQSNIDDGWAVGWPTDPVTSVKLLREGLNQNCAVIIGDSCCHIRRLGVSAFALTVAGIDPIKSEIGSVDLFGRELHVTSEALADQLATAANMLMGNAAQSTPTAIVRNHEIPFSPYVGWVHGIEPEEDLFRSIL